MQLGNCFNRSEDSEEEDEILFSRGRRPIRRRSTCPLNLRDVLPDSGSSSEEIEPSNTPPSLLRPTPTFFDFTHNTAFHSRRSNDTLSSLTSPDIRGTNGDSSLFPSASSNSWLTSQNASGRIRQAGDKEQPPGTSTANYTKPPTSRAAGNSIPRLSSRSKETPESKHRKATLEKFRKKLQETDTAIGSDWAIGSAWQGEHTATDTPSPDHTNPPESSKPPTIPGPFQPQPLKTLELQPTKLEPKWTSKPEPPGRTSAASHAVTESSFSSTATGISIPKLSNTSSIHTEELNKYKDKLRRTLATIESTEDAHVRKWGTGHEWKTQPPNNLSVPHKRKLKARKPVTPERPASPVSSGVQEDLPEVPNETLQRFLAAVGWTESLLPANFVDGVDMSSDETKDNWSAEDGNDQLNSEWLDLSPTDVSNVEDTIVFRREKARAGGIKRASDYPRRYSKEMLPVYKALLFLGRLPFEIDLSEAIPRYKYNRKSWRYFLFIVTSVITFLTAILMIANFIRISTAADPLTVHETATKFEEDKYWIEATLEIVSLLFLAISSVSMLEYGGGTSIVDFLNRWSAALAVIRCDVTSGLKTMTIGFFCCYAIYAGTFVLLFFVGEESFPTVRGSCGVTGLLILNSFTEELRFWPAYRVVEFLGLFVHLYTTLATSLLTLVICLHCWALDNAAKRFNRRLAGCLRQLGFRNLQASQAYPKIFAEHLMVTSFPRQIGKVFRLALIAYLGCKMVELTVTTFGLTEPIVNGFPKSEQKFFNGSSEFSLAHRKIVPVLILEPSHIQSLKCGFYVAKTWIPWLIFMEIVQRPGSSVIKGAGLTVRNFLRHSRTSHALRFITSMEFSFSSRIAFHVNPGMQLTREFAGKFGVFALVTVLTFLQFIPSAVNPQAVVICDHFGGCSVFRFPPKLKSHNTFKDSVAKVISEKLHATTQRPLPPIQLHFPSFVLGYPPCFPNGRLPQEPPNYSFKCQEESSHPVYIPTYFRRSSDGKYFKLPPTPEHSCVQSSSIPQDETLFDCFGDDVSSVQADECGNPKLPTPDATGAKKLPILRAVRLNREIFCCFVYSGLENQAERCNLLSTGTHSCSRKSGTPDREIHEESIARLWNTSSEAFVESQLPLWTECLCQGLDELPVSSTACTVPSTNTTSTSISTSTSTSSSTSISTSQSTPLPQTTSSVSIARSGFEDCPGSITTPYGGCVKCPTRATLFKKFFLTKCSMVGPDIFGIPSAALFNGLGDLTAVFPNGGCYVQTSPAIPPAGVEVASDCYGAPPGANIGLILDDCGSYPVAWSDRGGSRVGPQLKPVVLEVGVGTFFLKFLCCWDYGDWPPADSKCNMHRDSDLTKICSVREAINQDFAERICSAVTLEKENKLYKDKCLSKVLLSPTATCDNGFTFG